MTHQRLIILCRRLANQAAWAKRGEKEAIKAKNETREFMKFGEYLAFKDSAKALGLEIRLERRA